MRRASMKHAMLCAVRYALSMTQGGEGMRKFEIRGVAFVAQCGCEVVLATQLNNARAREDRFRCSSMESAGRLWSSVKNMLEAMYDFGNKQRL